MTVADKEFKKRNIVDGVKNIISQRDECREKLQQLQEEFDTYKIYRQEEENRLHTTLSELYAECESKRIKIDQLKTRIEQLLGEQGQEMTVGEAIKVLVSAIKSAWGGGDR